MYAKSIDDMILRLGRGKPCAMATPEEAEAVSLCADIGLVALRTIGEGEAAPFTVTFPASWAPDKPVKVLLTPKGQSVLEKLMKEMPPTLENVAE